MPPTISPEERQRIRREFPALAGEVALLENAGGSQVPGRVADAMRDYLLNSYVQLGAGYPLSRHSTQLVDAAHEFVKLLMGAAEGHVVLGPSCSALLRMLADCYGDVLRPGQQIVLAESGHEANVGPWLRLARRGIEIKWWRLDRSRLECPLDGLESLLSSRTAIVALPHVSNLLGGIVDLPQVVRIAHRAGARVVADGVAFAPHRAMNVGEWDVDWYAYSTYKVYGPHMAALYGKQDAFAELEGPNHFFIGRDEIPYKFELGGVCHEGCAGLLALGPYLNVLAGRAEDEPTDRRAIVAAFQKMQACEQPLLDRLLAYLSRQGDVTIVGPITADDRRVGTVSFVHNHQSSRSITDLVDGRQIAIRHGHMYAYRLCQALGLNPEDGVVRTSFVHYNSPEEIERLIEVFESIF